MRSDYLDQRRLADVLGPEGSPITLDDLPPPDTTRWVIRRKAAVVAGVRAGLLSLEEACARLPPVGGRVPVVAAHDRTTRRSRPARDPAEGISRRRAAAPRGRL